MTFHLINTADERTWSKTEKILFLGEWCLKYSRKHIWKNLDFEICKPFLNKRNKKISSVDEVFYLAQIFLPKLASLLNQYHKTNYSDRYWEILIGHWLIRFISSVSNRYYLLKYALDEYDISNITFLKSRNYKIATLDTLSSVYATNCEIWNNMVFSKIYNYLSNKKINSHYINICDENFSYYIKQNRQLSFKKNVKNIFFNIFSKFTRDTDAVIFGSYLSLIDEIKLNLSFSQVPFQCTEHFGDFNFKYKRKNITLSSSNSEISLYQFLNKIIFSAIPVAYVENYSEFKLILKNIKWPKNPKFIFTSNLFDINEIFKYWVADKVENSIPYFVGQHGNNYGQHLFEGRFIWPERSTSNGFITWGWQDKYKTTIKGFNFKKKIKKSKKSILDGIVLIRTCVMFRYFPWDVVNEFKINLIEQYDFLENLSKPIFKKVTVRLHHTSSTNHNIEQFKEKENLKKRFPLIKIDDGVINLQRLVNKNKLFVFAYDGTGILEFLLSDIPFIAFWSDETNHLIDDREILELYEEFYEVGIFFKSGKDASIALNKRWNDIIGWWNSKNVKLAKEKFMNKFSSHKENTVRSLVEILKKKD